jgi:hypothetical protein
MLRILVLLLIAANLAAQTPVSPELERLRRQLQDAIRDKDLSTAADIAAKLDDAVQRKFRASLIHDASDRVNDVLTWLPSDTETLLVYREPFVISAEDSPAMFYGRPARLYATDRLMYLLLMEKANSFRFAPPSRKTGVLKAFWGYVRSSEVTQHQSPRGVRLPPRAPLFPAETEGVPESSLGMYPWCTSSCESTSRLHARAKSASNCSCRERTHGA